MPRNKLFDVALKDALARGEMTSELRAHINDPVVRLAHWFELVTMLVIVFLMVFRPFSAVERYFWKSLLGENSRRSKEENIKELGF